MTQSVPPLHIHLFGTMQVLQNGQPITDFASRKAEALLAYLLLNPQSHPRETLADLLWDDRTQKQALGNLRVLLSNLRKLLPDLLLIERQTVQLDATCPLVLDTAVLQAALAQVDEEFLTEETAVALQNALKHYHGPLLAGLYLRDARRFEEWLLVVREKWQQMALRALQQLALHQFTYGDLPAAARTARRLAELDPLNERSQQLLLRVLARQGRSNAALQQYQQFAALLQAELGVPPAPETERLYQRIRQAKITPSLALPDETVPLVGRQQELATLQRHLDDHATRLVTVVGIGGVGKTRLALAVAHQRQREYLNGVCFVSLASAENEVAFLSLLAQAVGLTLEGKTAVGHQLLDFLRDREMLLVLDNVEQIVDEVVAWIQLLLAQAADIQLLLTSRERLRLREEWVLPLSGLAAVPQDADEDSAAFALLQQRTAQFAPTLLVDEANLSAAKEICRLVEGVPLALELAAAAFAYHTPVYVATELKKNLDFLRTQLRDVPERHRSMRAVFAHSWALLTEPEQQIFAQLSVFHGGFTLAAAKAVTSADRFVLESLLAKSLIQRQTDGRYLLHTLLRQFAAEKLADVTEQKTAVYQKYSDYFSQYLLTHLAEMTAATGPALQAIAEEFDNIQAVWRLLVDAAEETAVARLVGGFSAYFYSRGLFHPGLAELTYAAEAFVTGSPQLQAAIRVRQALFWGEVGNHDDSIAAADEAMALVDEGETAVAAIAHLCRGYAYWAQGNYAEAKPELEQAIAQARLAQLGWVEAQSLNSLGNVLLDQGDPQAAQAQHKKALAQASAIGQRRLVASALTNLGNDFWHAGEFDQAHEQFAQSLQICQDAGIRQIESLAYLNIGLVESEMGRYDRGVAHMQQALAISREVGDRRGEGNTLLNLLAVYKEQGRFANVADLLPDALAVCRAVGDQQGESMALDLNAHVHLLSGEFVQAEEILAETWRLCTRIGDAWGLMETRLSQAQLSWHLGDFAKSVQLAEEGLTLTQELADQSNEAKGLYILGNGHLALQKYEAALDAYQEASARWQALGQPHLTLACEAGRLLCLHYLKRPLSPQAVDQLTDQLLNSSLHGLLEPGRALYLGYRLLTALADERAELVRERGELFLRETAVQFPEPSQQEGYLHKIQFHQALLSSGV